MGGQWQLTGERGTFLLICVAGKPPLKTMAMDTTARGENAAPGRSRLDEVIGTDTRGETTVLGHLREWMDALVIAFVLAMFIRTFVVELFKIPSGSMSPTLLGDYIAEGPAFDRQGQNSIFLFIADRGLPQVVQVFRKNDKGHWRYEGRKHLNELTSSQQQMFMREGHAEEHRILVNKFAYWFELPDRGDIAVFRVPFKKNPDPATDSYERNGAIFPPDPFIRSQAVYVKRVVGLPGETVELQGESLVVDGEKVTEPPILERIQYNPTGATPQYGVVVPPEHVLMFGDNSDNSKDSRYWGPLPVENLRGRAILRYWPLGKFAFLNKGE